MQNQEIETKKEKRECFGKRCNAEGCKMKLKLTDMPCKCGLKFCYNHKPPNLHDCSHNFRESAREILQKRNPLVVAAKVQETI